ncbi:MAG: hypothetical protein FWH04_00970 [Oscillospiraceae bacterium]|nr:hypothetical protein [Oscillospiraceae bacterium]
MRRHILIYTALLCLGFLAGCIPAQELLLAPRPAVSVSKLQNEIDKLLQNGYQPSVPLSGKYRQAVQMYDLDGDGEDEAILFVRDTDNEGSHRIYIFKRTGNEYVRLESIEETAESIHSVAFCDLSGGGEYALMVGWQVGDSLRSMSVYALKGDSVVTMLSGQRYWSYGVLDITNGQHETASQALMLIFIEPEEGSPSFTEMYTLKNDLLECNASANLSKGVTGVRRVLAGTTRDGYPALYVTCKYPVPGDDTDSSEREITDVFAYRNQSLDNISISETAGISDYLVKSVGGIYAMDVNKDGIVELPIINPLPFGGEQAGEANSLHLVEWVSYDSGGNSETASRSLHNILRGWYFRFPDNWPDDFTVSSEIDNRADKTVIRTIFSVTDSGLKKVDFLKITDTSYKSSRPITPPSEILLRQDASSFFTASARELPPELSRHNLDDYTIKSHFGIMEPGWNYMQTEN